MRADEVYAILKGKLVKLTEDIKSMGDWKPIQHKGTVQTADDLPTDAKEGWMYNIATDSIYGAAGMNVVMTSEGWDPMGPIINMGPYLTKEEGNKTFQPKGNYLSGTDSDLKESGKAADAKVTGEKIAKNSSDITKKLDKNQGVENSGKIAGINESGDIVPIFPVGVDYNSETNCLEFGSDQKMELNQGIGLDSTLTKTGSAADAGATGEEIASLKEDLSNKITKFYTSSQGKTHLVDSDNGKIMDMMLYGKSEQKQYSGKNLIDCTLNTSTVYNVAYTKLDVGGRYSVIGTPSDQSGVNFYTGTLEPGTYTLSCTMESGSLPGNINIVITDVIAKCMFNNGHVSFTLQEASKINLWNDYGATYNTNLNATFAIQIEKGSTATSYEPYTGGIPSPNPDYPQEIKSVVNPTVNVCGKNLLDVNLTKANINTKIHNGVVEQIDSDTRADLQWKIIQFKSNGTIIDYNEVFIMQGTRFGCAFTAVKNTAEIAFGLNGEKTDTTVRIPVKLKVGQKYVISCNLLNSTQGSIKWDEMMLEEGSTITDFEPYHEQTVTLPYTLNAVPVSSGGNVTIDGQQYIADYVDVERGKLVRMVSPVAVSDSEYIRGDNNSHQVLVNKYIKNTSAVKIGIILCDKLRPASANDVWSGVADNIVSTHAEESNRLTFRCTTKANDMDSALKFIKSCKIYIALAEPEEIDLATEEITAFKALVTYYSTTNISVNSEQLDGYTVFNYPISMENGWNYVKQQIGDTRDYIYDMDARTQDTDLQAAEAYVNSEYAVALTELEV